MDGCEFCKDGNVTMFRAQYVLPYGEEKTRGMYIINNRGFQKIAYHNGTRKVDLEPIKFCPFCGRDLTKSAD